MSAVHLATSLVEDTLSLCSLFSTRLACMDRVIGRHNVNYPKMVSVEQATAMINRVLSEEMVLRTCTIPGVDLMAPMWVGCDVDRRIVAKATLALMPHYRMHPRIMAMSQAGRVDSWLSS